MRQPPPRTTAHGSTGAPSHSSWARASRSRRARSPLAGSARLLPALLAAALAGCAYVSPTAIEDKVDSLDQDGDGAPFGGRPDVKDCDDFNDQVAPGFDEIPYDGVDNDCGGDGDLLDIDGDGYAGISKADYEAAYPDAEWPSGVSGDVVDCVDDPAVHPEAKSIYPGAADTPYDGVDSDCGADTDFDVDGDGYLPDTFLLDGELHDTREAYDAYVAEWGYDLGTPTYGDCDDFDEQVYAGAPGEAYYDGVDTDCLGDNDFDQDGDGWMPDEAANAVAYENFLDKYHGGVAPEEWGPTAFGDCLDEADAAVADPPETVYPGAADAWYDGIDSDCAADNDFDQDGDGVMPDNYTGTTPPFAEVPTNLAFQTYVDTWGYALPEVYGDCNDENDQAYPGAIERFGDAFDSDCDTGNDSTPWAFGDMTWTEPRPPQLTATNNHYVLVTTGSAVGIAGLDYTELGVALTFDKPDPAAGVAGAGYMAPIHSQVLWQGSINPQPLGYAVDVVANGDYFHPSTAYLLDYTFWTYGVIRKVAYSAPLYIPQTQDFGSSQYSFLATDLDVVLDTNDEAWVVLCDESTVHAMKSNYGNPPVPTEVIGNLPPNCEDTGTCTSFGPAAGICFAGGPPDATLNLATFHVCDPGVDCATYEFDPVADDLYLAATQPFAGYTLSAGDFRDGWYVLTDAVAGGHLVSLDMVESYTLFPTDTLLDFDAMWYTDPNDPLAVPEAWGAALIDNGNGPEVHLTWGDPNGTMQTAAYPFVDPAQPDLVPEAVTLYVDEHRIALAVSAVHPTDPALDTVGWVFLGWP